MDARLLLGASIAASFCAWGIVTALYVWPELQALSARAAIMALMTPHMFRLAPAIRAAGSARNGVWSRPHRLATK